MSRDRFDRLAGGTGVVTLDEQDIEGTPRESRAERIVSLLRLLNVLPEADVEERAAAFGRGAAEGASFGFMDELAGGVASILSPSQRAGLGRIVAPEGQEDRYAEAAARVTYEDVRDTARGQQQRAAEAYPGQFIGGAVAGGAATGRAMPQASAGMTGASRVLANVGQALGEGVIAGVGGSRAETVQGMAEDAVIGGALGGGISGGLAAVGGLGRGLRAAQRGVTAVDTDAARAADLVTDIERIGSVIEDDRIRLKPDTIRTILAENPPDPRAIAATRAWFDDMLGAPGQQGRLARRALDQGITSPRARRELRNLQNLLNDQRVRFEQAIDDPAELFAAADQAKRLIGSAGKRLGSGATPDHATSAFLREELYPQVQRILEADAWGGAGALQRANNPAWTEFLARRDPYESLLEGSGQRTPGGWQQQQRASRPAIARVIRGGSDITQQDYVSDLVEGARSRATLTERLAHHEGSRLTPELTQQARSAADEIAEIARRAQNPSITRRLGQEIGDSTTGRRVAAIADVVGEPLERRGGQASAATSRGAPTAATASTATMTPRAQPVMDDEAEIDALLAEDDDEAEIEAMLGD